MICPNCNHEYTTLESSEYIESLKKENRRLWIIIYQIKNKLKRANSKKSIDKIS